MPEFMPKLISRVEGTATKTLITSDYWNEIFNLLIEQGNYNTNALKEVLQEGAWSLGHVILDPDGISFGRRKYLKFVNATITEDAKEDVTIVTAEVGPVGPEGPRGLPSPSLIFKARYDTLGALQAAHPVGNLGDVYAVGAAGAVVAYGWDDDANVWTNLGALAGIPGVGVPAGGTAGQVLTKVDGTDYNTAWGSLPSTLQYLTNLDTNIKAKFTALDLALSNVQTSITLTANRVVVTDTNGKLAASSVTSTELNYVSGFTSDPQTQLNNKLGILEKANDSSKIDGRTIYVSATQPSAAIDGDIWFKV